jgi:GNAT superfamily N-acetyltransferase
MAKQELPIAFRHTHAEDIPFIFNSWLQSYRHSIHVKNIANTVYFGEHHKVLERIMKRSEAIIACDPTDQTQIFGYIVYEIITGVLVVHYAYVKLPYRKLGIMKQLLEKAGRKVNHHFVYTHETHTAHKLALKFSAFYNPYPWYQGYETAQAEQEVTKEGTNESN